MRLLVARREGVNCPRALDRVQTRYQLSQLSFSRSVELVGHSLESDRAGLEQVSLLFQE